MDIPFGVHIPNSRGATQFNRIIRISHMADMLGFDSIWVADHVIQPEDRASVFGSRGVYDPIITLASLSSVTSSVKLGTAVLLPLRHPLLLAQMLSTLDHASNGRLVLGLGAGWFRPEFDALGVPYSRRGKVLDETIQVLKDIWTSEVGSFDGEFFRSAGISIFPKPIQKPHPPIILGGSGRNAIRRVVAYAQGWIPTDFTSDEYASGITILEDECKRVGRSKHEITVLGHLYTILGNDRQEARRRASFLVELSGERMENIEKWSIIGTPQDAINRVHEYVDVGVRSMVLSVPPGLEEEMMRTYAEKVMPNLK